jgi:cytochrome c oxidase assembly protein subunit 15
LRESFNLTRTLVVMPNGKVVTGTAEKVIHMFHRGGALVVLIYIVWLCWRAARLDRLIRRTAIAIFVLVLLQPLLGVTAIAMNLPIIAVTAHNAIAALLLLSVVNLYHHLTPTGK